MADRAFYRLQGSLDNEVVLLAGHFQINASGGVVAAGTDSKTHFNGGTLTRTGTGAYTLALKDRYAHLLHADVTLVPASAGADIYAEISGVQGWASVAASGGITVTTRARSTRSAADNSGGTAMLSFEIIAKNSTVTR